MKASIYTMNKKLICDALLTSYDEVTATVFLSENVEKDINDTVYITIYDDVYGLLTYKSSLLKYSMTLPVNNKYPYTAEFKLLELEDVLQRRGNVKVKTDFACLITLTDSKFNILSLPDSDEDASYVVHVLDISASGILFSCKEKFKVGQLFTFDFTKGTLPVIIFGEIIRTQKQADNTNGYGCRFVNISPSVESIVRGFVFKTQLANRRRSK